MRKATVIVIAAVALAAFVAGAALLWNRTRHAPDLAMETTTGQKLELASMRGKPVLITFWATTCPSCIKELPALAALYRRLHPKGLELIGVSMFYDMPLRVVEAIKQEHIPYPVVMDLDQTIARAFSTGGVTPTAFLIAPDGRIVLRRVGSLDFAALEQRIERLLPRPTSARGAAVPQS